MDGYANRITPTLQTLPAWDDSFGDEIGKMAEFSLHAGVMARADERQKLERLCRYISRPALHYRNGDRFIFLRNAGVMHCRIVALSHREMFAIEPTALPGELRR